MNKIDVINFYIGNGFDNKGRHFTSYAEQTARWWEETHDFIQWAFPNPGQSMFNCNAPLLQRYLIGVLTNSYSREVHQLLLQKFRGHVNLADLSWLMPNDHNILRISRVLIFCQCTNHRFPLLRQFREQIPGLLAEGNISLKTAKYWQSIVAEIASDRN